MIKVFVAEDQQLILKDLCRKIERSDEDITIVGTALNGKMAYEKMLELKPDILFTDIRMPLMTGLELIKQVTAIYPNLYSVVISGYKDFEYAREAIKIGVSEYLLKPLSFEDVQYVMEILKVKITTEKEEYIKKLLESLINSKNNKYPHINTILSYEYYYVMTITVNSFPTFCIDYAISQKPVEELIFPKPIFQKRLKEEEHVYSFQGKSYKEEIFIFCLNETSQKEITYMAKKIVEMAEKKDLTVTICISRKIQHVENVGIESQIMRAYVLQNLVFAQSKILNVDLLSLNNKTIREFLQEKQLSLFMRYVENGNNKKFNIELNYLLCELKKNNATQQELELSIKQLFHQCFIYSKQSCMFPFELDIDEYITNSKTYDELYEFLSFLAEQLIQKENPVSTITNPSEVVEEIKHYMEKNYAKDININDIVKKFYLTPAYFSRLFKKHTGKKPIEYLTKVRIDNACAYFQSTDFAVKQIAELCGYQDPLYFSKIFKSIVGKTPSEYRIACKKGQ